MLEGQRRRIPLLELKIYLESFQGKPSHEPDIQVMEVQSLGVVAGLLACVGHTTFALVANRAHKTRAGGAGFAREARVAVVVVVVNGVVSEVGG